MRTAKFTKNSNFIFEVLFNSYNFPLHGIKPTNNQARRIDRSDFRGTDYVSVGRADASKVNRGSQYSNSFPEIYYNSSIPVASRSCPRRRCAVLTRQFKNREESSSVSRYRMSYISDVMRYRSGYQSQKQKKKTKRRRSQNRRYRSHRERGEARVQPLNKCHKTTL